MLLMAWSGYTRSQKVGEMDSKGLHKERSGGNDAAFSRQLGTTANADSTVDHLTTKNTS